MPMSDEKIEQVCRKYHDHIIERGGLGHSWHERHILEMLPKIVMHAKLGRREKAMRWLGFVQGWFWSRGTYTIKEMADHNRPDDSVFQHDKIGEDA